MSKRFFIIGFGSILVMLNSSCKNPSPTSVNTIFAGGWNYPDSGAYYVYRDSTIDTSEGILSPRIDSNTIYFLGLLSLAGKQHVEKFSEANSFYYLAPESNGDISFTQTSLTFPDSLISWLRYPTGEQAPFTVTTDSTRDSSQGNISIEWRGFTFFGTETIAAAGKNWLTYHVRDSLFEYWQNTNDTFIYVDHYWLAPELGNYVRWEHHMLNIGGSPAGVQYQTRRLVSYSQ